MNIPSFLFGSRSVVTRRCAKVAERFVSERVGLDAVQGELLDTSQVQGPLVLSPTPGLKGFLLYLFLEAFWTNHCPLVRDDDAFCAELVRACVAHPWSLLCLMAELGGPRVIERSNLGWEVLEALDRAWPIYSALGERFTYNPLGRELHSLSGEPTAVEFLLFRFGERVPLTDLEPSMATVHQLIAKVVAGGKSEMPPMSSPPRT